MMGLKKGFKQFVSRFHAKSIFFRWFVFVSVLIFSGGITILIRANLMAHQDSLVQEKRSLVRMNTHYNTKLANIGNRVYARQLVSSQKMVSMMQFFTQGVDVKLVSLRNLPAVSYESLYLHPVNLVVQGSYRGVFNYLRRVEASPYRIFWKSLHLHLMSSGLVEAGVNLETLSQSSSLLRLGGNKSDS
jgi:hypothetical protein